MCLVKGPLIARVIGLGCLAPPFWAIQELRADLAPVGGIAFVILQRMPEADITSLHYVLSGWTGAW